MRKRDDITKEELEACLQEGLTMEEISRRLHVCEQVAYKKLKEYGLKSNGKKSSYDEERVKQYLAAGMTNEEIGAIFGVCRETVGHWIHIHRLSCFRRKKPVEKRKCSTCFYKEKSKTAGNCDYLRKVGHSRGCPVIGCTVYRPARRKRK